MTHQPLIELSNIQHRAETSLSRARGYAVKEPSRYLPQEEHHSIHHQ
jgi:hypothetical protein